MNIKKSLLVGIIFALVSIIIFLLVAKVCTSDIECIAFALMPGAPGLAISALLGIDASKRILGFAVFAWISLIIWFLIGFLGTLLVQWIKSKIKK